MYLSSVSKNIQDYRRKFYGIKLYIHVYISQFDLSLSVAIQFRVLFSIILQGEWVSLKELNSNNLRFIGEDWVRLTFL